MAGRAEEARFWSFWPRIGRSAGGPRELGQFRSPCWTGRGIRMGMRCVSVSLLAVSMVVLAGCHRAPPAPETGSQAAVPEEPQLPPKKIVLPAKPGVPGPTRPEGTRSGGGALLGVPALAAWNALPAVERDRIREKPILYLHQSVGQDLEDGCEANGFKFEYVGPDTTSLVNGPNGGIFTDVGNVPNGEPFKKMNVIRKVIKATKGTAKIVSFSFGYADMRDEDLAKVQAEYQKLVSEVKASGARFVHITPPLVYSIAENPPKQKFRAFQLATFKDDVIFDLQDIESTDGGKRCEENGVWRICQSNRSTPGCASKGQGIDGDGAGHLCERKAREIAKGLLQAFYLAAR